MQYLRRLMCVRIPLPTGWYTLHSTQYQECKYILNTKIDENMMSNQIQQTKIHSYNSVSTNRLMHLSVEKYSELTQVFFASTAEAFRNANSLKVFNVNHSEMQMSAALRMTWVEM